MKICEVKQCATAGRVRGWRHALVGAAMAAAMSAAWGGLGCDSQAGDRAAQRGEPAGVYVTRGVIESIKDAGKKNQEVVVHHEPIPEFKDASGVIVGMGSMEMGFPAPLKGSTGGIDLSGYSTGDKVEIKFAVWYKPRTAWEIVEMKKLDPSTPLKFGKGK